MKNSKVIRRLSVTICQRKKVKIRGILKCTQSVKFQKDPEPLQTHINFEYNI